MFFCLLSDFVLKSRAQQKKKQIRKYKITQDTQYTHRSNSQNTNIDIQFNAHGAFYNNLHQVCSLPKDYGIDDHHTLKFLFMRVKTILCTILTYISHKNYHIVTQQIHILKMKELILNTHFILVKFSLYLSLSLVYRRSGKHNLRSKTDD